MWTRLLMTAVAFWAMCSESLSPRWLMIFTICALVEVHQKIDDLKKKGSF